MRLLLGCHRIHPSSLRAAMPWIPSLVVVTIAGRAVERAMIPSRISTKVLKGCLSSSFSMPSLSFRGRAMNPGLLRRVSANSSTLGFLAIGSLVADFHHLLTSHLQSPGTSQARSPYRRTGCSSPAPPAGRQRRPPLPHHLVTTLEAGASRTHRDSAIEA